MASRKVIVHPPPKPWKPDIARWLPFLREGQPVKVIGVQQDEPTKGWQLYRLDTLEDANQNL